MILGILGIYIGLILIAIILYIPKFIQFSGAGKKVAHKNATVKRRISVVIPARNESKTIPPLLDSLARQSYDSDYFDVNIIVKDENDPTIELAKEIGANVFVVPEQTCKGEALDGYFKRLLKETLRSYDAFVIVDADAVLADNYLSELNNALEYDRQIFVTRKGIKNYLGGKKERSVSCNCSALTYPVVDDLSNNYRSQKDMPLNFCGQGLMVRREVIEQLGGWPYRTLTEDFEIKMDGYLKGFTSMYYPYAIIYTEEALTHKENYIRRVRWLNGVSDCEKLYKKQVKEKLKADDSFALKFDFLYYQVSFIIALVATLAVMATGIVFVAQALISGTSWLYPYVTLILLPSLLVYGVLWLFSFVAMFLYRDMMKPLSLREKVATLYFAPFHWLEFIPIYLKSKLSRHNNDWKQTQRIAS